MEGLKIQLNFDPLPARRAEVDAVVVRDGDVARYYKVAGHTVSADPVYHSVLQSCCDCKTDTRTKLPDDLCEWDDTRDLLVATLRVVTGDEGLLRRSKSLFD